MEIFIVLYNGDNTNDNRDDTNIEYFNLLVRNQYKKQQTISKHDCNDFCHSKTTWPWTVIIIQKNQRINPIKTH